MIWTFRIFCTLLFALCVQAQFNFPGKIHRPKGDRQRVHSHKVSENNKKGKYLLVEVPDEYLKKILGYGSSGTEMIDSSEQKTDIHIVPGSQDLVPMPPPNQKPYPNPHPHPRQFPPLVLRRIIMQWLRRQKMRRYVPIGGHGNKPMIAWKPMVVYGGPNHLHRPWGPPNPERWGLTKPNPWGRTNPVAWGPPQPTNIETSAFDAPDISDYADDYEQEDKRQKGQKTQLDEMSFEEAEADLEDKGTEIEEVEMSHEDEKDASEESKLVHRSSFSFGPPGLRSIV